MTDLKPLTELPGDSEQPFVSARETPKQPSQGGQERWVLARQKAEGQWTVAPHEVAEHIEKAGWEVVEVCPVSEREKWEAAAHSAFDTVEQAIEDHGKQGDPPLLPLHHFVGHRLSQTAEAYQVQSYRELLAERDRLALELADLKGDG